MPRGVIPKNYQKEADKFKFSSVVCAEEFGAMLTISDFWQSSLFSLLTLVHCNTAVVSGTSQWMGSIPVRNLGTYRLKRRFERQPDPFSIVSRPQQQARND